MVYADIRGKRFPLCFTAAALDAVTAECGGLDKLAEYLNGNGTLELSAVHTAIILGILIQEGEENRLVEENFRSGKASRRRVPSGEDLLHLLGPVEALQYRPLVMQAVNDGMAREIEALPPKNGDHAEQA